MRFSVGFPLIACRENKLEYVEGHVVCLMFVERLHGPSWAISRERFIREHFIAYTSKSLVKQSNLLKGRAAHKL